MEYFARPASSAALEDSFYRPSVATINPYLTALNQLLSFNFAFLSPK
jgi:hypothetical protein